VLTADLNYIVSKCHKILSKSNFEATGKDVASFMYIIVTIFALILFTTEILKLHFFIEFFKHRMITL